MFEEEEDERPEWEIEDEKIPASLEKRWKAEEAEGMKAGVCTCGYPFTKEDLSCKHCGKPVELSEGAVISLKRWLFHSPMGVIALIIILTSIIAFLVR